MPAHERTPAPGDLTVLEQGEVEVVGQLPWSSNRTFLVTCALDGVEVPAVYKPARGERTLWDFPPCIYRREIAAYELSELLGWDLVPLTVERVDAPFGPGSLQRFMPADFTEHHFTLIEHERHHERLQRICAFDVAANNTDRKSGHCLLGEDGVIWAIDNGLCFHRLPKLRTVIWEFAGDRVPPDILDDLAALPDALPGGLERWLDPEEVAAIAHRAEAFVSSGRFPVPDPDDYHHFPWPLV